MQSEIKYDLIESGVRIELAPGSCIFGAFYGSKEEPVAISIEFCI